MDWIPLFYQGCDKQPRLYCIRCGKLLSSGEARYSKDDPDHEEALCPNCCNRCENERK